MNDVPVANNDSAAIAAGGDVTINVLDNDVDPDSSLTVTNLTPPAPGTGSVELVGNAVTYTTPNPGFTGTAVFSYTANHGEFDSNVATVSVDVGLAETIVLAVTNGWDQKNEKTLIADAKLYVVQNNDNDWWETHSGYFTRFELGGDAVPEGATVTSVKVYFEYWQEEDIDLNTLMWHAANGTIDLENPNPIASIIATTTAPDRLGENQEGGGNDPWEICDEPGVTCTAGLVNDLKIVIENMDTEGKKALLD